MQYWPAHPLDRCPQQPCPTCRLPVVVGVVEATGRRIALNPEPAADGGWGVVGYSKRDVPFLAEDLPGHGPATRYRPHPRH